MSTEAAPTTITVTAPPGCWLEKRCAELETKLRSIAEVTAGKITAEAAPDGAMLVDVRCYAITAPARMNAARTCITALAGGKRAIVLDDPVPWDSGTVRFLVFDEVGRWTRASDLEDRATPLSLADWLKKSYRAFPLGRGDSTAIMADAAKAFAGDHNLLAHARAELKRLDDMGPTLHRRCYVSARNRDFLREAVANSALHLSSNQPETP